MNEEAIEKFKDAINGLLYGHKLNPAELLSKSIENSKYAGNVIMEDIQFISVCKHHLLPFFGTVKIEYSPNGKLASLGGLYNVVESLSRRLQIQEDMTQQICDIIDKVLSPTKIIVEVIATHTCLLAGNKRNNDVKLKTVCVK